jgi:transcriptional regulator with XRE-family HTH domain
MLDSVGERIQRLRRDRGLSLRQLAKQAGVPQSSLSAVETGARGGRNLTLDTGKRLAKALGVTLDYLAGMYEEEDQDAPAQAVADEGTRRGKGSRAAHPHTPEGILL